MSTFKTLTLSEAAAFVHLSAEGLRRLAKAGRVPGRKVGNRWVFVDAHLAEWLRGGYAENRQTPTAASEDIAACLSTNAKTRPIGGSKSNSPAARLARARLGLPTK